MKVNAVLLKLGNFSSIGLLANPSNMTRHKIMKILPHVTLSYYDFIQLPVCRHHPHIISVQPTMCWYPLLECYRRLPLARSAESIE